MRRIITMLVTSSLLFSFRVRAEEHKIKVDHPTTPSSLAKHYYGSTWKAVYLSTRNKLKLSDVVAAGSNIYIPGAWFYSVKAGDTLGSIAKKYLGDTRRYALLATTNRIKPTELEVGQRLLMPFHLHHRPRKGDSWRSLAKRYYRSEEQGETLQQYNLRAQVGTEVVVVPITDQASLGVAKKPAPEAPAKQDPQQVQSKAPMRPTSPLPVEQPEKQTAKQILKPTNDESGKIVIALEQFERGDFASACPLFDAMLVKGSGDPADLPTVLKFLAYCAVAYDSEEAAIDYFDKMLQIRPSTTLDPIETSPKILKAFHAARSKQGVGSTTRRLAQSKR